MNTKFFSLTAFLIAASLQLWAAAAKPVEDKASLPILTPSFSERQTAKIELENGLKAYLISDPHADKSSAALVVKTGCWNDPEEHPGMAHFLEHLLFLGNKKYPEEAGYDRFMTQHGGKFNAFTATDFTGYIFAIDHSALPEAFDRFSSFFKEPLFNPSGVGRELNAIDQEYAKNLEDDDIRAYYVHKEISTPGHPHNAFSIGNRKSLENVSREALIQWYKTHYSADKMTLEVISNLPLDQLSGLVIDGFSSIPVSGSAACLPSVPVVSEAIKGHIVYIDPIKNVRRLVIIWELPFKFSAMRATKPELPICHLLGHEGKGSLIDTLKQEKLIEGLHCGAERLGGNSFVLFIQLDLTDAGVKRTDQAILKCFEALAQLREKGIPSYISDEIRAMSELNYQYQAREDAFEHIFKEAMHLSNEGIETYPEQSLVYRKSDPKATSELLRYLSPENALFELMAPESLTGVSFENREQWLGAAYTVKAIPEEILQRWKDAPPSLAVTLPEPNRYLPENTKVTSPYKVQADASFESPRPKLLIDNESGKLFFAQDKHYAVPIVSWLFEIKTPAVDPASLEAVILGDLFVKYANEALSAHLYPAAAAGLQLTLQHTYNGIFIGVGGYSDKAEEFFLDVLNALKDLKPREHQFKAAKESLVRQYQNEALESPFKQSYELLLSVLYKNYFLSKEKASASKKITYDTFLDFCSRVFEKTYVEGILYGSMNRKKADAVAVHLLSTLSGTPYPKEEQPKEEVIVLPKDQGPFLIDVKSKVQGNAALLTLTAGPYSLKEKAIQQVLMQAAKEPFFSTLRTKQQTGYVVFSKADDFEQHLYDFFGVQSNTHEPRDLLARFELFLESFLQEIDKSSEMETRFENIKRTTLETLKKPPQSMDAMAGMLFKMAFNYDGDFDRIAKLTAAYESLSFDDFLEAAHETFGKGNKQRLALLFFGTTPDSNLKYRRLCNLEKLKEQSTYEPASSDE